jgi:hypothetical protein
MAGMNDVSAYAQQCRRLASEFRTKALAAKNRDQQQTMEQMARSYEALAHSWLAIAQSRANRQN